MSSNTPLCQIVPYPSEAGTNTTREKEVLLEQIYNSWHNGYVLGYPQQFVDSYCRSFHSELRQDEKEHHAEMSKVRVKTHIKEKNLQILTIAMGMDSNLLKEKGVLEYLSKFKSNYD
jgi:hypothetical protein